MREQYTQSQTPAQGPIVCGVGHSSASRTQIPDALQKAEFSSLEALGDAFAASGKVGDKGDCPCLYAGVPRTPGDLHKENFGEIQLGWLDLDGCVKSQGDFDALCTYFETRGIGVYWLTSSSHAPDSGAWKIRGFLRYDRPVTWEENRVIVLTLLRDLAEVLGVPDLPPLGGQGAALYTRLLAAGVDPAPVRATQPIYVARWRDESARGQAWRDYRPGGPLPTADYLARWPAAVPRPKAPPKARGPVGTPGTPAPSTVDPLTRASLGRHLDALPDARPGTGQSDLGLWRAARLCALAGLGEEEIAAELAARWPGHPAERYAHKARGAAARIRRTTGRVISRSTPLGSQSLKSAGVDPRYLPPLTYPAGTRVLFRRAECGSGKTHSLRPAIAAELAAGGRVVVVVHRRALARRLARELGLPCYLTTPKGSQITGSCVVCLDSLPRLALPLPGEVDSTHAPVSLCIVDESEQVARHMVGGTLLPTGRVGAVWAAWRALAHASARIILQDADAGDLSAMMVRQAFGATPPSEEWEHHAYQRPYRVDLRSGDAGLVAHRRAVSEAVKARVQDPATGLPVAEFFTSKTSASVAAEEIRKDHPTARILIVDGDSTGEFGAQRLADDPSTVAHYDYLAYTTALSSGIDIQVKMQVFGTLEAGAGPLPEDCWQALQRSRPATEAAVWVGGAARGGETDPAAVRGRLALRDRETRKILDALASDWTVDFQKSIDPGLMDLFCAVEAHRARQGRFENVITDDGLVIPGTIARCFESHGAKIHYIDSAPATDEAAAEMTQAREDLAEGRKAVVEARRAEICAAEDLREDEARDLRGREPTREIVARLKKYDLQRFYGRDPDRDLVARDERGRKSQVRAYADLELYLAGRGDLPAWRDALDIQDGGIHSRHRALRAKTTATILRALGWSSLDSEDPRKPVSADVEAKIRWLARNVLGIGGLDRQGFGAVVGAVLDRVGLRQKSTRTRSGDTRERIYRLDKDALEALRADAGAYIARSIGGAPTVDQDPEDPTHHSAMPAIDVDAILVGLEVAA